MYQINAPSKASAVKELDLFEQKRSSKHLYAIRS